MKKKLKKIFAFLHLWLGLVSGLIVFVICITAAIWAFSPEMEGLQSFRHVTPQNKPYLPVTQLQAIANAQFKDKKVRRIEFPARDKAAVAMFYDEDYYYSAYINPYNGQVLKINDEDHTFFRVIILGHYSLWMGSFGREVVRWATLVFLLMLISGIVLWWPKNKAARKQRFKVKFGTSPKRLNYDLHNVLGFYASWVVVFAALTGVIWTFDWAAKTAYFVATGGQKYAAYEETMSTKQAAPVAAGTRIDSLFNAVRTQYGSKAAASSIDFPDNDSVALQLSMYPSENVYYNSDNLYFDQYTLQPLKAKAWGKFADGNNGEKLSRMNYDIHIGSILGFPGRVAMFLAVLIGASLPVTGFYIWWGRKKKQKKKPAAAAAQTAKRTMQVVTKV